MISRFVRSHRSHRFPGSRAAVAVAAGSFFLLAGLGTAHAGSWASLNADGSVVKSRGVLANFKDGAGLYRVVFKRPLEKCVAVASSTGSRILGVFETGNPGEVSVSVQTPSLNLVDGAFYVALVC